MFIEVKTGRYTVKLPLENYDWTPAAELAPPSRDCSSPRSAFRLSFARQPKLFGELGQTLPAAPRFQDRNKSTCVKILFFSLARGLKAQREESASPPQTPNRDTSGQRSKPARWHGCLEWQVVLFIDCHSAGCWAVPGLYL